jgi:hypothetical protein
MCNITDYEIHPLYHKAKEIFKPSLKDKKLELQLKNWKRIMEIYGFQHLGTGSYGSAYIRPDYPWVFKIFRDDPAYLSFITYAKDNQGNPNLPKIGGDFIPINNDTYVVKLEKLSGITDEEFKDIKRQIDVMVDSIFDAVDEPDMNNIQLNAIKMYPGIYQFLQYWYHNMPQSELDIKPGNIMARGDIPVLLDPIVQ